MTKNNKLCRPYENVEVTPRIDIRWRGVQWTEARGTHWFQDKMGPKAELNVVLKTESPTHKPRLSLTELPAHQRVLGFMGGKHACTPRCVMYFACGSNDLAGIKDWGGDGVYEEERTSLDS